MAIAFKPGEEGILRPATVRDIPAIWRNIDACWREGAGSWEREHMPLGPEEMARDAECFASNLHRPPTHPGWQRYWLLSAGGKIVGHADLTGGRFTSEMHVARAGIALREAYCGRGWGRGLMEEIIRWAWDQPTLEKIELTVFGQNARAIRLYESLGFTVEGVARARFRLHDRLIDDVQMALFRSPG
ncbi:MAG: GNAT family N-acetyltransferase [Candidatus Methylomirabilis sp.]|nr:GNAT family N-acetyltransferase [Deltaproteobacteria bacterium]